MFIDSLVNFALFFYGNILPIIKYTLIWLIITFAYFIIQSFMLIF